VSKSTNCANKYDLATFSKVAVYTVSGGYTTIGFYVNTYVILITESHSLLMEALAVRIATEIYLIFTCLICRKRSGGTVIRGTLPRPSISSKSICTFLSNLEGSHRNRNKYKHNVFPSEG